MVSLKSDRRLEMKVFKAVRILDGRKVSVALSPNSYFLTTYIEGETSYPPIGKLFAFRSYTRAKEFIKELLLDTHWTVEIWRAEAKAKKRPFHPYISSYLTKQSIKYFWQDYNDISLLRRLKQSDIMPEGTVLCDSVTLLELEDTITGE